MILHVEEILSFISKLLSKCSEMHAILINRYFLSLIIANICILTSIIIQRMLGACVFIGFSEYVKYGPF